MLVQWQYQRSSRVEWCDRPRRDCVRSGLSPQAQDAVSFKDDVTLPVSDDAGAGEVHTGGDGREDRRRADCGSGCPEIRFRR